MNRSTTPLSAIAIVIAVEGLALGQVEITSATHGANCYKAKSNIYANNTEYSLWSKHHNVRAAYPKIWENTSKRVKEEVTKACRDVWACRLEVARFAFIGWKNCHGELEVEWRCKGKSELRKGKGAAVAVACALPTVGASAPTSITTSGRGEPGSIRVVAAVYGGNCSIGTDAKPEARAKRQQEVNKTSVLSAACHRKESCAFKVDWKALGSPVPGCNKTFVARWECQMNGREYLTSAGDDLKDANGSTIELKCPRRTVFEAAPTPSTRFRDALGDATLASVNRAIALDRSAIEGASARDVALALHVLREEGKWDSSEARALRQEVDDRRGTIPSSNGKATGRVTGAEVYQELRVLTDRFSVPCVGAKTRTGIVDTVPVYACASAASTAPLSQAPEKIVDLTRVTLLAKPPEEAASTGPTLKTSEAVKQKRLNWIRKSATDTLTDENHAVPERFCVESGACFNGADYKTVARAIFGDARVRDAVRAEKSGAFNVTLSSVRQPPVFCRAAKKGEHGTSTAWSETTAVCSSDWKKTAIEDGTLAPSTPPWACVGSDEFLDALVLPSGGRARGFVCRRRIFEMPRASNAYTQASLDAEVRDACTIMRRETWGEDIAQKFLDEETKAQAATKGKAATAAGAGTTKPPVWIMTREELLYFFGHKNTYCKANHGRLVHRKDPKHLTWAKSFTCGVARGLIEAGPFEEGVQVCATMPYVDRAFPEVSAAVGNPNKARLHCWKFERPECKDIVSGEAKKTLWKSDVFDDLDAFGELRRTRNPDALAVEEMSQLTEVPSFEQAQGYTYDDALNDSGIGAVKEFCRFHGASNKFVCGYDLKTMAQYYELRAHEAPERCESGVCARGHYERGYSCAVATSTDFFDGTRPFWLCGYDRGPAGRKLIDAAHWVCDGGRFVHGFVDAAGNRNSLRCGKRAFFWGETAATATSAARFDPLAAVHEWAADHAEAMVKWTDIIKVGVHTRTRKKFGRGSRDRYHEVKQRVDAEFRDWGLGHEWELRLLLDKLHAQKLDDRMTLLFDYIRKVRSDRFAFLGHRTTTRLYYLQDFLEGVKTESPILYGLLTDDFDRLVNSKPDDPEAVDPASELRTLIKDVIVDKKRAPDGKWFQEVRNALADESHALEAKTDIENGQSIVMSAFVLYALFDMLDYVRAKVLSAARTYALQVVLTLAASKEHQRPLSRLELLERARIARVDPRDEGPVYCVEKLRDPTARKEGDKAFYETTGEYVCGSTPLILTGAVEIYMMKRRVTLPSTVAAIHERHRAARRQAGSKGGAGVRPVSYAPRAATSRAATPRPPIEVREIENEEERIQMEIRNSIGAGWCYGATPGMTAKVVDASIALARKESSPWTVNIPKIGDDNGRNGWFRCEKFQFSDETWLAALLKDEKMAESAMSDGGGKTGGVMSLIAPAIMKVISKLGNVVKIVDSMSGVDLNFLGPVIGKATQAIGELQRGLQTVTNAAGQVIAVAKETWEKATDAWVEAEKNKLPTKEQLKKQVKEAKEKYEKLAKDYLRGEIGKYVKQYLPLKWNGKPILDGLVDLLVGFVTGKIIGFIKPKTMELVAEVIGIVQPIYNAIKNAIASAVASVPFVGGVLAMAVNTLFEKLWDKLVDFLNNKLLAIVERFLAKAVRGVLGGIVDSTKKVINDAVASLLSKAGLGEILGPTVLKDVKLVDSSPADAWLERALACNKVPRFTPREARQMVAAADRALRARSARMLARAPQFARRVADHYLAKFGHTLDSWTRANSHATSQAARALTRRAGNQMKAVMRSELSRQKAR
ncbi:MAG: hypothetical protein HYY84_05450 [Deltaproteobacteria bacterium]|nr:hypothetical protein [Deltaproteobacteria bacterium]